jgi:O-antigen ligase
MSALLVVLITSATLAFGAVYPWGYIPLFCVAAATGGIGLLLRRDQLIPVRSLAFALLLLMFGIALQLVPLNRAVMSAVSAHTPQFLEQYNLTFKPQDAYPISIDPRSTLVALAAVSALGLFLVGSPALLSRESLRALPTLLISFAAPLALFGIVSRQLNNGLVYWFWKPHQGGGTDAFGPFVNRNHFAGWMLMASCLALGALLGQIEREADGAPSKKTQVAEWLSSMAVNKLLMTAVAVMTMVISLVWTLSRSGIIGLAVAICCFIWLTARRRQASNRQRALTAISLLLLIATGVWLRGVDRTLAWFGDSRDLKGRFAAWEDGWHVVTDFPVAGIGLNTYSISMSFYQKSPGLHLAQAHNDYLQLLAEGGLLVTIPAIIAVAALALAIRRNLVDARPEARGYWIRAGATVGLVSIAVQEIAEFSLQIPANSFLFCTLAAVALSPVRGHAPLPKEST